MHQAHIASWNAEKKHYEIEFIHCNVDYKAYLSPVEKCARKTESNNPTYWGKDDAFDGRTRLQSM